MLLALSAAFSLALGEIAVRIIAPQPPSWLAIYRRHPELPFHALQPAARALVDTGETRWSVATDDEGFRVGDEPGSGGPCTALWLGDSFAFGHGVDFEDSFVGLVGEAAPDVRPLDTAAPGYGPIQYRQILEVRLRIAEPPDFVYVATFVGNDFHDTVWEKDVEVNEGVLGHAGDWKSSIKTRFQLYRLATKVYHRFAAPDDPYARVRAEIADPATWEGDFLSQAYETYRNEMARIQELGRENDIPVRFVLLPTKDAVLAARAGNRSQAGGHLPVSKARGILEVLGAEFLDVTEILAGSSEEALYFPFDGHFTPVGNRIVAEAVLRTWPLACPAGRRES